MTPHLADPVRDTAAPTLPAGPTTPRPSADFDAKLARTLALLRHAATTWAPVVQASSLGAEDVVLTHLIARERLPIRPFVLDTGLLHDETLALLARSQSLRAQRQLSPIVVHRPQPAAVAAFVAQHGPWAMRDGVALRKACCHLRKVEPLGEALRGAQAWVTGLRRAQSDARADVRAVDDTTAPRRLAPLVDWTDGDVWHLIHRDGIDHNALHARFFPSIGCAPCTRAVTPGEDPRAGRWWWEHDGTRECGLHAREAGRALPTPNPEPLR